MAILGGAGNPVGGSFTGPAEALEIVGNHCFAYSGEVPDAASGAPDTTLLKFTSGNYYSLVKIGFSTDQTGGDHLYLDIILNNSIVYSSVWDDGNANWGNGTPIDFLIPSYSEFEMKWGINSVTKNAAASIVGRIYRTTD
jgi:hypothetical protein